MPLSLGPKNFLTTPLLSINALNPLFVDLIKKTLFSIDLKIAFAKCWSGPIVWPNHASSEIFTIKFFCFVFWDNSGKSIHNILTAITLSYLVKKY